MHQSINAIELFERLNNGENLILLDLRETLEYHTYNIGGKNIPLPLFNSMINEAGFNKTDEIIVVCKAGLSSDTAAGILIGNGFKNVRNLTGGLLSMQKLKNKTA